MDQIPVPETPKHFKIGFGETPDYNQIVQVIDFDKPEPEDELISERDEYIILPSERKMMDHFFALYASFLEHLNENIEQSFLMSESDKIKLFQIYAENWGMNK